MGIGWKQPNRCQHPDHKFQVGRKAPKLRTVPLNTLALFNERNSPLPVGSAFCFSHLKSLTATQKEGDDTDPEPTTPVKSSTPACDNYVPDTAIISDETLEEATSIADCLCDALVTSPLSFQIKQKRIEDLSEGTKLKVKMKFERVKSQLEKRFAEAIAPGQSEELISQVLHNEDGHEDNIEPVPEELAVPVKIFKESDSLGQLLVLAVIDHGKYTKEFLMKVFNCKKHQIDQARKMQKENSGLSLPKKEKINRDRMPQEKIEHFLEFLFSPWFAAGCSLWCE